MKNALKQRLLFLAVIPMLVATFVTAPSMGASATQADRRNPLEDIAVAGTIANGGTFQGKLDIVSFGENAATNTLEANGLLSGVLRDASGHEIGRVQNEYVTLPASLTSSATGADAPAVTCAILHLTLGPLDLNLLGLVVHLNRVVLDITAQGGPGNLLGNLLCAIAHLLDGFPPPLGQIIDLLNRVIDLLGG